MENLENIIAQFAVEGTVKEVKPLGNGLINDTFKVTTEGDAPDYVLQRINNAIFKDVDLLQSNIEAVTSHIRKKLTAAGEQDIDRKVLSFVPVKGSGKTYLEDGGKFWRISVFIPDAKTHETINPEFSYYAGKAFGHFEAMLADIKETLGETIPDFHNMELRLRQLAEAVKNDAAGRIGAVEADKDGKCVRCGKDAGECEEKRKEALEILQDLEKYGEQMCKAEKLHREGKLPKRICHCDTKVNNMLFDNEGNVLCVIDLDTVMPSYVFSDFGDFLRTAANTGKEDDPVLENVNFDMEIFNAFSKGYIESARTFLTPIEIENLPYAACLFPFMQAVRFFADYINGDTYYKIQYPEHNLVRTKAQLKLFHSAMDQVPAMQSWIAGL